jgi:hypothetical protein
MLHYSMSEKKFGSSPKANSNRNSQGAYSDRPTGAGFGASDLTAGSKRTSPASDTVFRTAGLRSSSEDMGSSGYVSPTGLRSSGRGFGVSNLGTSSTKKDAASKDNVYASPMAHDTFNNLTFIAALAENTYEHRLLRNEMALDRELMKLEATRESLQSRYHIEIPHFYEYEQAHSERKPRVSWGAMTLGATGGAVLSGLTTAGSKSALTRISTTVLGGVVSGAIMGAVFNETALDVRKEQMHNYIAFLEDIKKNAEEQPNTHVAHAHMDGRIIQPEQQKGVSQSL